MHFAGGRVERLRLGDSFWLCLLNGRTLVTLPAREHASTSPPRCASSYKPRSEPRTRSRASWVAGEYFHGRLTEYERQLDSPRVRGGGQWDEHYRAFIELWKDADPELQPRVATARQRLRKLTGTDRAKR